MLSHRFTLGGASVPGTTDIETIRKAFRPLAEKAPFLFRGKVLAMLDALTHQDVRDIYAGAGGEEGVKELSAAITRIGKGETVGLP